ncbi:MAG TPA: RsmB/NOP family class I SAM-dependent RNA methyltransferase [Anaeromyxobacter sp.]|nr:RsmB/NOP family class I SAM-dependent RNA methyltransferase [Anaeromyxobacter sp.]
MAERSREAPSPAERRVAQVAWDALAGLAPALDAPLAEILGGAAAERVLDRLLRRLGPLSRPARAAVAEAVFGVALWRRRLRAQLGLPDAPPRHLLGALLRDLGGRADWAALAALAPAALPPAAPPPAALADRWSLPDWLAEELVRAAGEDAPALAGALDQPGPICLRVNPLRTTTDGLAGRLAEEGVTTAPGQLVPGSLVVAQAPGARPNVYGLGAFQEGLFEVQDEGSQLLGLLVEARAGDAVLDACAGAGGKTLLLAAAVGPRGRVHAADPDAERLERLRARAARAGADAMIAVHGPVAPQDLLVDRALVDAPCSELGALRRGPDVRWRLDPAAFAALPALQLAILEDAARRVRAGGRLVYATCTFRREEDEAVAEAFERAHPEWRRVRAAAAPAETVTPEGFVRTWPHRHGTDGFFAAVWERAAP